MEDSSTFRYNFFHYFKLFRYYGSYHYHFLVVRKDCKFQVEVDVLFNNRVFSNVKIEQVSCFYFCEHFLQGFQVH